MKVWEWGTGRLLGSEQVGRVRDSEGATDDADTDVGEIEAVTKVCCSSQDPPLVVASVEKLVRCLCTVDTFLCTKDGRNREMSYSYVYICLFCLQLKKDILNIP